MFSVIVDWVVTVSLAMMDDESDIDPDADEMDETTGGESVDSVLADPENRSAVSGWLSNRLGEKCSP